MSNKKLLRDIAKWLREIDMDCAAVEFEAVFSYFLNKE